MTEAASTLPGLLAVGGLAPDIAGRITMALAVVERVRTGLAEKVAAFADVPAALLVGLDRLRDHGGVASTALVFGLMLAAGFAAERLLGLSHGPRTAPDADAVLGARLVQLLLAGARELVGLLIFKSQGVAGTDDDALMIRAKFTARPGRQFVLWREIYAAVQQAFTQYGILPTGRRVDVHFAVAGGSLASSSHSAEVRVLGPATRPVIG